MLPHPRILVADDDPELLAAIVKCLELGGAEVVSASNGVDLIERIAEGRPFELVITDVSMPWMSGLQVMQTERSVGLRTPVIVITALRNPRVERQVQKLEGSVLLLRKPFTFEELEAAVMGLLGSGHVPAAQGRVEDGRDSKARGPQT